MTAGAVDRLPAVQCLAPFEPREPSRTVGLATISPPWIFVAVGLAAVAGAALLLDWPAWMDALQRHALLQAEIAIVVGAVPGYLLTRPRRTGQGTRPSKLDLMCARPATPPAPLAGYTHYLPCALIARDSGPARPESERREDEGRAAIAGTMYVGPSGIRFEPGAAPPRGTEDPRAAAGPSFEIGPVRLVRAQAAELTRKGVERFTGPVRYGMLMQWPGGRALFAVPSIGDTLPKLHDCLDTLRFGPRL